MKERKIKKENGVTLIELMIVLVIAAVLVGGIYTLFTTQQRSYSVQDQVVGVQQDARAALDMMTRDIRSAGFLTGGQGFNVNGAVFAITHNNISGGTDSITVVHAGNEFTSGGNPVTVTNVAGQQVTLSANADASIFDTGNNRYVAFEGENHVYQISGGIGTQTITLTESPPSHLATSQSKVFRVQTILFRVQANTLQRGVNGAAAQPLAGDGTTTIVEDLQFAYRVEGSNDWIFDQVGDTWPAGATDADIRMVRINIIMRTVVPDSVDTSFFKPACEDSAQSNVNPGCRRRVYSTVVKIRNL